MSRPLRKEPDGAEVFRNQADALAHARADMGPLLRVEEAHADPVHCGLCADGVPHRRRAEVYADVLNPSEEIRLFVHERAD